MGLWGLGSSSASATDWLCDQVCFLSFLELSLPTCRRGIINIHLKKV